jgi:hypothetical protein
MVVDLAAVASPVPVYVAIWHSSRFDIDTSICLVAE